MKLGKIFICINILVLSLLMLTGWPRIIYQNTDYRFDEHVLDDIEDGCHKNNYQPNSPEFEFSVYRKSNDRLRILII